MKQRYFLSRLPAAPFFRTVWACAALLALLVLLPPVAARAQTPIYIALMSDRNPVEVDQPVEFRAQLIDGTGMGLVPRSSVTFYDDGMVLGAAIPDYTGVATLSTVLTSTGAHNIVAEFSGDSDFSYASAFLQQIVIGRNLRLQLTSNSASVVSGQAVSFQVVAADGNGTPYYNFTGPVQLFDNGAPLPPVFVANGIGSSATTLNSGTHYIYAQFFGDGTYQSSMSPTLIQEVTAAPLPVELTAFTATAEGRTAVRLAWATASEKNSKTFGVERSANGTAFEPLSAVPAAGQSSTPRGYGFIDEQLPTTATTLYYRLRQLDYDGTVAYSPVRTVNVRPTPEQVLTLAPSPARLTRLAGVVAGQPVQVFDAAGRLVLTATADAAGTAQLALPQGWTPGLYVVRAGPYAIRWLAE